MKNIDLKTETEIQKEIMDYLTLHGWEVYRMNSGTRAGTKLHKPGTPDLMIQKNGTTIWIEVKRPGEKPSVIQKKRHEEIRANGFKVFVVTSLDELLSYSTHAKT